MNAVGNPSVLTCERRNHLLTMCVLPSCILAFDSKLKLLLFFPYSACYYLLLKMILKIIMIYMYVILILSFRPVLLSRKKGSKTEQ